MPFLSVNNGGEASPETVEEAIVNMEKLLGISITIHNSYGKLRMHSGLPVLIKPRSTHRKNFMCGVGFCQKCSNHCGIETNNRAAESKEPFIHECWKGLSEIVIPIYLDGIHIATFFAGTWKVKTRREIKFRGKTAAWIKEKACLSALSFAEAKILISLLSAFARGIFCDIHAITQSEPHAPTRKQETIRFLRMGNPATAGIQTLAKTLHISPSRASHVVQNLFGKSFRELVKQNRIDTAQSLLTTTDLPVKEIALRVGVDSQYHFSRLFRQATGLTPLTYRKRQTTG